MEYIAKNSMRIKRRIGTVILGLLIFLVSCGKNGGNFMAGGEANGKTSAGDSTSVSQMGDLPAVMGRYMELEIPYAENSGMYEPSAIIPEENGLYLQDGFFRDARVELSGKSFSKEDDIPKIVNVSSDSYPAVLEKRKKNNDYILQMVMGRNGARMYIIFAPDEENGDNYYYEKYFMDQTGQEQVWNAGGAVGTDKNVFLTAGDDGNFYALTMNGEEQQIYRVDGESGETSYMMELYGDKVYQIIVFGGKLYAETQNKLCIYDPDTGEELDEDKELTGLVRDELGKGYGSDSGFQLCPGEDDSLYVATKKGLYRHVLYGNVSEQLIDGSLCSLGDVSKLFVDMYVEKDGENGMPVFFFLYDNGKLMRFAFDPAVPAVPEKTLVIYSLCENRDIRLVVNAYQAKHKDIFVKYEVGMSGEDGVTREDALNVLATRIAAGEGPDVFLLDDLPYRSYREKGVLMDLDPLYKELQKNHHFFDKVIGAFYQDGELNAIPMMFSVPLLVGKEEELKKITDAESIVRATENAHVSDRSYRMGLGTAESTLLCMSYTDSINWLKADGSLDKEALKVFLDRCKRLYQADRADIAPENLETRENSDIWQITADVSSRDSYRSSSEINQVLMRQIVHQDGFAVGTQGGEVHFDLNLFYTWLSQEEMSYKLLPGTGNVFLPIGLFGINRMTPVSDEAVDFVKYALAEYQVEMVETMSGYLMLSGITTNRDILLAMEKNPYNSYEPYSSHAYGYGEDEMLSADVAWQKPEVYEAYNAMLDSLDTANFCELELLRAVIEQGAPALVGEKTVEEAVDQIAKKVQIYLAE